MRRNSNEMEGKRGKNENFRTNRKKIKNHTLLINKLYKNHFQQKQNRRKTNDKKKNRKRR